MSVLRNIDDSELAGGNVVVEALYVVKDSGKTTISHEGIDDLLQEEEMILPLPHHTTLQHIIFAAKARNALIVMDPSGSTLSYATARLDKLIHDNGTYVLYTQNAQYELIILEEAPSLRSSMRRLLDKMKYRLGFYRT